MAVQSAPQPQPQQRLSRWRINMLLLLCFIIAAVNGHKLFKIQVLDHDYLATLAEDEFRSNRQIQPERGIIRDANGGILAMNVDRDTLAALPRELKPGEAESLALVIAPLVGRDPQEIRTLMADTSREYVVLGRRLTPEASDQIRQLKNPGLLLAPEPTRVYPHGSFAATVVGVANHENAGISGVEGYANEMLAGVPGVIEAEIDPATNSIWIEPPIIQEPRDGVDITLTIDPVIQHIVEDELRRGIDKHGASGGTIIVMDPNSGAVLGMASWPLYDPNHYGDYPPEVYNRNPAITDQYEPGSTFKVVNLAIGLQSGAYTPDTVVPDPGFISRAPGCCSNWNGAGNSPMNPANVLYYSSNVGALQFAEMVGAEGFYQGVRDFGYGEPTGIELAGEATGMVQWPDTTPDWRPIVLSTTGYGQGISVTPLQHVRAIAAVANGGKLMQPYVIKEWCEKDQCHATEPKVLREVIEPGVSEIIKPMMVRAANGQYAHQEEMWFSQCYPEAVPLVPGYNVAAKTGTSSIPDGNGGYEASTIGSIAGFGPTENPQFAVLVKLDRTKDIWGVSAIPVYAGVMKRLFSHYQLPPNPDLIADCQKPALGLGN